MLKRTAHHVLRTAVLFMAGASTSQAHHVMDYALPASALDGLLSGLGHPVIGLDHFLFIVGAGILAANWRRGYLLPLTFVAASILAAAWRVGGAGWQMGEAWVALTLIVLGVVMLVARNPRHAMVAALFLFSGFIHGYALSESIVGAERTPLLAYFAGLTLIQYAIAIAAWALALRLAAHRPGLPLRQLAGGAVGAAGLLFAGLAAL